MVQSSYENPVRGYLPEGFNQVMISPVESSSTALKSCSQAGNWSTHEGQLLWSMQDTHAADDHDARVALRHASGAAAAGSPACEQPRAHHVNAVRVS